MFQTTNQMVIKRWRSSRGEIAWERGYGLVGTIPGAAEAKKQGARQEVHGDTGSETKKNRKFSTGHQVMWDKHEYTAWQDAGYYDMFLMVRK